MTYTPGDPVDMSGHVQTASAAVMAFLSPPLPPKTSCPPAPSTSLVRNLTADLAELENLAAVVASATSRPSHDESLPLHAPPPVSGVVPTPMVAQKPKTRPSSRMDKKQHRGKKLCKNPQR